MTRRAVAVLAALAVLLLGAVPAQARPTGHADQAVGPDDGWEEIIAVAARATREARYRGEAVWVSWDSGAPSATVLDVAQRDGVLEARPVGTHGASSAVGRGWPYEQEPSRPGGASVVRVPQPATLTRKYEVTERARAEILARACAVLDFHARADGALRERLWVDVDTGILLRRESYQGDRLLRIAAFLSLETESAQAEAGADPGARSASAAGPAASDAPPSAVEVDDRGVAALRAAGWAVPERLPGGFDLEEVHAHGGGGMPPLQMVYGDGLYALSLFVQQGAPDWDALPAGAEPAEGLDFDAYEWPGRSPRRLVWSSGEETFTLVGDAAPDEFRRIAESLPHTADEQGGGNWVERLLSRLGHWWARLTG